MAEEKNSFYSDPQKLQFQSLVYPDDLDANNFYPDCVCFTIKKRTGVSVDDVTTAIGDGAEAYKRAWIGLGNEESTPKHIKQLMKKLDKEEPSEAARQKKLVAAVKDYKEKHPGTHGMPENMLGVLGNTLQAFGQTMVAQRELAMQKDSENILGNIYLNMPNGIQFNEAASWAGESLGFMGKATQDLITGEGGIGSTAVGALAGGAGSIIGATVGAIPSLVSKLGISGGMFGAAIGAMAAGSPIQKGMESALGVAQNPYMEMMFSGVGFRKFQFEFILRPKSTGEVATVGEILRMLRTFTKPTFTEGKLGKSFMDYPMEFGIEFLTQNAGENSSLKGYTGRNASEVGYTPNPYVPKIKTSVCDNVTSNFTPQSIWAAHNGGAPIAVNLSLSFQETELVMAEDVYNKEY